MKAWAHNDLSGDEIEQEIDLNLLNTPEPVCIYCRSKMEKKEIPDLWNHSPSDYIKIHKNFMNFDRVSHP